jgi:ribosomal protein S6--L-glutamate ligase
MRIGILSRDATLYSTSRLKKAALERGHEVEVVDYLRCYMNITAHRPSIIYKEHQLDYDVVIPRIGATHTFYGTAVVRQFEMMGVFPANESQAIIRSRDKLRPLDQGYRWLDQDRRRGAADHQAARGHPRYRHRAL